MKALIYSRTGMTEQQTPATLTTPQIRNKLKDSHHDHEKILKSGEYIKAEKRDLYLIMQDDGNLCLYPSPHGGSSTCIWASDTYKKGRAPYTLVMQEDGNLVIYDADRKPTWATGTHGKGSGCHFYCQDDGNLVVYDC